jgi:hypothetical protein
MKAIDRRLSKLEDRLGLTKELFLVVLSDAGKRGIDDDTCIEILRAGGFLSAGGVVTVDLTQIPSGLNAEETKRFVRENGARISGPRRIGEPGMEIDSRTSPRSAAPTVFNVQMDHWKERLTAERPGNEDVR